MKDNDTKHFLPPARLVTEQFTLRAYQPGDGPLLADAVRASYDHLAPFMAWPKTDLSDNEAEADVRRFSARYLTNEEFMLAVLSPDGSTLLGSTGFHLREGPLHSKNAEIGMWVRVDQAGRGFGTALLRAVLDWGFSEWPWERLAWLCRTDNIASRRVAEKCGLVLEGTLRSHSLHPDGRRADTRYYAALRADWSAAPPPGSAGSGDRGAGEPG